MSHWSSLPPRWHFQILTPAAIALQPDETWRALIQNVSAVVKQSAIESIALYLN